MSDISTSQIALFGGSFNPPHMCHTLATLWVLQTQAIDEVWWIPTFQHAFAKELVDFSQRLEMCERATADLSRVRINTVERRLGGESRTIDTVNILQDEHPQTKFWLIIGADILDEVHRWKDWQGLMERVGLIVVGRRGYERASLESYTAGDQQVLDSRDLDLPDVSSTKIRSALSRCAYHEIKPWIPRQVLDYIATHKLYTATPCS